MTASLPLTPDARASGVSYPRRVAALIDTAQVSGPGRQLAALARSLGEQQVEMLVVLFHRVGRERPPFAAYLERAGVSHLVLAERGPFDLGLVRTLRRTLDDWRPDVVETHGYKPSAQMAILRRLGAPWPWLAFFHGSTTENLKVRVYHWLDRRFMARADRLVVMSRKHLEAFADLADRTEIVYNAVIPLPEEGERVDVASFRASAPDGADAPMVGVVGRLSSEKGVDVFLHACAELVRRGVPFSAVIAGDGPDRATLERLRDELGLASRVRFLGAVRAVSALYPQLDLVVLPSRSEGLPNVLLEALRADRPTVATRVGAVPEVLTDAEAGIVVPPENVAALADGIERALPLRRGDAPRAARLATVERFSLAHRVGEHLRLYTQLLARTR